MIVVFSLLVFPVRIQKGLDQTNGDGEYSVRAKSDLDVAMVDRELT